MQYWDDKGNLVTLKDSDKKPGIIDTPSDAAGGYKEVKKGYLWPDSDNDGIPDIWEQAYGMNPEDPTDANQISTNVDPNGVTPIWKYISIIWCSISFIIRMKVVCLWKKIVNNTYIYYIF